MHSNFSRQEVIKKQFIQLGQFLENHSIIWTHRPFFQLPVPWEQEYAEISQYLKTLQTPEHFDIFTQKDRPLQLQKICNISHTLTSLKTLPNISLKKQDIPYLNFKIPKRKQNQIFHFLKTYLFYMKKEKGNVLDWCSGKGHLGRLIGQMTGNTVLGIETQQELCERGKKLAQEQKVHMDFLPIDVLKSSIPNLDNYSTLVALHACGELNEKLIQLFVSCSASYLILSPCCPHKRGLREYYTPLSKLGKNFKIPLSLNELKLAITDEYLASTKEKNERRKHMLYRLAFDILIQKTMGKNEYTPIPPFPLTLLREPFSHFCEKLSQRLKIKIPPSYSRKEALQEGENRLRMVLTFGQVLNIFKRPLELWLILDRVMYLLEHNVQVEIGTFCEKDITPRNILIIAKK